MCILKKILCILTFVGYQTQRFLDVLIGEMPMINLTMMGQLKNKVNVDLVML